MSFNEGKSTLINPRDPYIKLHTVGAEPGGGGEGLRGSSPSWLRCYPIDLIQNIFCAPSYFDQSFRKFCAYTTELIYF